MIALLGLLVLWACGRCGLRFSLACMCLSVAGCAPYEPAPEPDPTSRIEPTDVADVVTYSLAGAWCPPHACAHELLRSEVVCDACGQPMRHELRENRGRR